MFKSSTISIFLFAIAIVANAQDFHRADSLMQIGNYELSAIEYERCYYTSVSAEYSKIALLRKAECYKKMQNYTQAAATLKRCAETYDELLQTTLCLYLSGQFAAAVENAENICLTFDTVSSDLLLLQTLSLNEMGLYDSAHAVALRLAATLPPEESDNMRALVDDSYSHAPQLKNENTARWLSIIPGLGHLYAGYPLEAATAFVINSAALGFGIVQIFNRCYITAYIGGAGLLSATYPGSMRSAEQHTKNKNQQLSTQFNQQCRKRLIDIQ